MMTTITGYICNVSSGLEHPDLRQWHVDEFSSSWNLRVLEILLPSNLVLFMVYDSRDAGRKYSTYEETENMNYGPMCMAGLVHRQFYGEIGSVISNERTRGWVRMFYDIVIILLFGSYQ